MIIVLPVGVDYQARRYPVVTFTFMGICTAIYLVGLIWWIQSGRLADEWFFQHLWLIPSESHWWTYLTSMFVHEGFLHLLGNMIYLFLFGSCVEDILGRVRFIIFYLVCGIVADFTQIAVSPDHFASPIPSGGASGAIAGCIGAFLLLLATRKIEFKYIINFWIKIWTGEFMLPAWIVISFFFLENFLMAALTRNNHEGGVAFAAHLGGLFFGAGVVGVEKFRRAGRPFVDLETDEEEEEQAAPARKRIILKKRNSAAPAEAATVFLFVDGAQIGPFTLTQVQQMFSTGAVSEDAFYWQPGMDDWRSAEELRQPGLV